MYVLKEYLRIIYDSEFMGYQGSRWVLFIWKVGICYITHILCYVPPLLCNKTMQHI